MIAIDQVLVSDEVVEEEFVCNLEACKGGCCVEGDAGAPLDKQELPDLDKIFEEVKPFLSEEGLKEIRLQGKYVFQPLSGYTTPTVGQGICAYGVWENGIVQCGIEKAWHAGKTDFIKPVSCHLYPLRVHREKEYVSLNYEPRETLCDPGCALGGLRHVPVYRFLEKALVRRFGSAFFQALDEVARFKSSRKR